MTIALSTLSDSPSFAADRLLDAHRQAIYRRTDRLLGGLLIFQWIFAVLIALEVSPRTWAGTQSFVHPHLLAAVFLGLAIIVPPVAMALFRPGRALTRHMVAAAQVLLSSLLIHLAQGRIEMHFHIFGSLAFLAFYRDWRVLITASLIVAADHFLRGIYWPLSVFGIAAVEPYRWLEHAGWVVFEDVFLIISCLRGQREMCEIAVREAALHAANARVQEASRSKSEFLANMSHEIRTPMTAILGFADLLLKPGSSRDQVLGWVNTIRRNGDHLMSLINDILDLSKIEAGKMTVEQIECAPGLVLSEVESLMHARAAEKQLKFEVVFATPIPQKITSDALRLRQILINLIGNALKFTKEGRVTVQVQMDETGGSPQLRFDVLDTGIGMTPAQMSTLCQPFTQADGSTTREFGGTGLGLAISRHFVQLLGGAFDIESVMGIGSRFSFTIDTGPVTDVPRISRIAELLPTREQEVNAAPVAQIAARVLVAEDGPDNQNLLRYHLKKAGITATLVADGKAACDAALAAEKSPEPFDCILMDMQMPTMDGYSAASFLRKSHFTRPIIALTAHAMAGDREKCIDAGCTDYVIKPIVPAKLLGAISKAVAGRPAAALAAAAVTLPTASSTPEPSPITPPAAAESAVSTAMSPADEAAMPWAARDPELREIYQAFVAAMPSRVRELEAAQAGNDIERLKTISHQLRGIASSFGFNEIATAAEVLELTLRNDKADFEGPLNKLTQLCRRAATQNSVKAAA